jgi:SAM-dependent methyltransferase
MLERILGRLGAQLPAAFRVFLAQWTRSHRRFVTRPDAFDLAAASQFNLLTLLGLREDHTLLDVGCGSLRAGRLFIVYLNPGNYFAIEPERWLVEAAIANEIGRDLFRLKRPTIVHRDDFRLSALARRFDFAIAGSIFSHAAPSQIEECLREVVTVLADGGLFLASFNEAEDDHVGTQWTYPGGVRYRFETMREMAFVAGLSCERVGYPYDFGEGEQTWLAFARVPAREV